MLEIKDLSVQYGKQAPTIEHFNLSMKKGEIISVVGESGSGKTTVIRAVLGALAGGGRVSTGDIQFNGHSLLSNTKNEWRNLRGTRISMIFQDCGGTLNLSVRSEVSMWNISVHIRIYPKQKHGRRDAPCFRKCVFRTRKIS